MKKYLVSASLFLLCAMFVSLPLVVNADPGDYKLPSNVGGKGYSIDQIVDIVNTIGYYLILLGVALGAVFIVWGGIQYMLAGGDDEKAKKARTHIYNGIIGVAVVVGVGLIIKTLISLLTPSQGGILS